MLILSLLHTLYCLIRLSFKHEVSRYDLREMFNTVRLWEYGFFGYGTLFFFFLFFCGVWVTLACNNIRGVLNHSGRACSAIIADSLYFILYLTTFNYLKVSALTLDNASGSYLSAECTQSIHCQRLIRGRVAEVYTVLKPIISWWTQCSFSSVRFHHFTGMFKKCKNAWSNFYLNVGLRNQLVPLCLYKANIQCIVSIM